MIGYKQHFADSSVLNVDSPFLFAVMFGDIGHGFIMALSAAAFIMIEKKYPRGFGEEVRSLFSVQS